MKIKRFMAVSGILTVLHFLASYVCTFLFRNRKWGGCFRFSGFPLSMIDKWLEQLPSRVSTGRPCF